MIQFRCPDCGELLQTRPEYVGEEVQCTCGQYIIVPESDDLTGAPGSGRRSDYDEDWDEPRSGRGSSHSRYDEDDYDRGRSERRTSGRDDYKRERTGWERGARRDPYDDYDDYPRRRRRRRECRACGSPEPPLRRERISEGGWIVFGVLACFPCCWPFCWIPLITMKEDYLVCYECRATWR